MNRQDNYNRYFGASHTHQIYFLIWWIKKTIYFFFLRFKKKFLRNYQNIAGNNIQVEPDQINQHKNYQSV